MKKEHILSNINFTIFYTDLVPSLKVNGGSKATGLCPFHDDHNPSLNINLNNGKWKCFVCDTGGDVFTFYMKHKKVDFKTALKELAEMLGVKEEKTKQKVVATFEYKDVDGKILYKRERVEPGRNGKKKEFFPKHFDGKKWIKGRGCKAVLYNLSNLIKPKYIIIVEGEGKVDLLKSWGIVATCLDAGASSPWRDEYTEILKGKKKIVILSDNDKPGRKYATMIAKALYGKVASLKVVELPGLDEKGDIIDWSKIEGNDKDRLCKIIKAAPEWTPSVKDEVEEGNSTTESKEEELHWEPPILFGQIETPEISAKILPSWLGDYAGAVSKNTQTPPAMSVMLALSVVATCLQKRFIVIPYNDDYSEPLCIWTITALPSGSRKTSVVTLMTKPLTLWEAEQREIMSREIAENETQREVIIKRIEKLKADAAKKDDSSQREQIINEIDELKEEIPEEKKYPRLWTGDITPEQLQNLMAAHGERMALLSDEGGIFENMSGLYSDGRANLDIFLKSHAGAPVRVDRGSRTVIMNEPALTFGLAIQPEIVSDLSQGKKKGFRGNGTLARFLYAMPKSNIGKRDVTQRNTISESVKAKYNAGIYFLLSIEPMKDQNEKEIPKVLALSKDALESWQQFSGYIENKLGDYGALETLRDWGSKLPGAALRIAGLMHVVEHGEKSTVIGKETMEQALDLCELLIKHAKAAFDLMGDDQATNDAKHILKWILNDKKAFFKRSEYHTKFNGRFKRIDRLEKALSILTERNIISKMVEERHEGRGRPAKIYYINPSIYEV